MGFDWDASVYAEVEREAADDARYFGLDVADVEYDVERYTTPDCPFCGHEEVFVLADGEGQWPDHSECVTPGCVAQR